MNTTTVTAADLRIGMRVEDNETAWAEVTGIANQTHADQPAAVHVRWLLADGRTETMPYALTDEFTPSNPYAATDCHNDDRTTGCYCDNGDTATAAIAPAVADVVLPAVVAFLADYAGVARDDVFLAAPGHEMTDAFGIAHEGHYDWPHSLPESIRTLAREHGIYIEVGAGWRLDLTPIR